MVVPISLLIIILFIRRVCILVGKIIEAYKIVRLVNQSMQEADNEI